MILAASRSGVLTAAGRTFRCALGRGGVAAPGTKREGDGATPAGLWPLRRVLFRPDRLSAPECGLEVSALASDDGWCDDPADPAYNRAVKLPHPGRCEEMWRADELYDVVVSLGYNDEPVRPGAGSAIFLHCAKPGWPPTEGCVALRRDDLLELLRACGPGSAVEVS